MTKIAGFDKSHIAQAGKLAIAGYNEERAVVASLPKIDALPGAAFVDFVDNELGVAMFDGDRMLGFLCCGNPRDGIFGSSAKGIFTPSYGHGTIPENRGAIYRKLYQAAARIWVARGITYHAVCLHAHDAQAIDAFFACGFGSRCVDAIRPMENFEHPACEGATSMFTFAELAKTEVAKVRGMRAALSAHLGESPCFMRSSPANFEKSLARAEARDSRLFAALCGAEPIAFIEVTDEGEHFATCDDSVENICGAYCLPEHRGKGVMQGLLNYVIARLKASGASSLGVDFESFNLESNAFWLKHFTAYSYSVTRRIDECALAG